MINVNDQERQCRALLLKIAAGATTITSTNEVTVLDELVRCGYVTGWESALFDERHFLDVQILPSGEARLRYLSSLVNSLSKK